MSEQQTADATVIAATYIARLTETIYHHLRGRMEKDHKAHAFVKKLMETPLRTLQMRPSFGLGSRTATDNVALEPVGPVIRYNPGAAILPPGPDCSFFKHIEAAYQNFKLMEHRLFLSHINVCLRRPSLGEQSDEYPTEVDLVRVEGWLQDRVKLAENYLNLKLSNRT